MARLLFLLTDSTAAPERAATGLWHARAAAEAGHDVALWLAGDGVRLAVAGVAETLREPLPRSAAEILEELAGWDVPIYAERLGFEQRRFTPDALRPGAEIADASALAALVADGHTPIAL